MSLYVIRLNISYIIILYVIRLNISLNDKWVVERLKFGSYCMINCGKTDNDIFPEFLVFHCLISGWPHIWSWRVYLFLFQLIALGFPCVFYNTPQKFLFWGMLFTIEIELILPKCANITRTLQEEMLF